MLRFLKDYDIFSLASEGTFRYIIVDFGFPDCREVYRNGKSGIME
jgi:hypothetical protein